MNLELVWCILSVMMIFSPMSGAALNIPLSPSLLQTLNASAPYSPFGLNLSRSNKCTKKYEWSFPQFDNEDCKSALLYMYIQEMTLGGAKRLEFLDREAKGATHLQKQNTPRKYTFRTSPKKATVAAILVTGH